MPRLGSNRLRRLAWRNCGGGDTTNFPYRRHVDLDAFFQSVDGVPNWPDPEASRGDRAMHFVTACNSAPLGVSGLPTGIEAVLKTILDLGEFDDAGQRDRAAAEVQEILDGYQVAVSVGQLQTFNSWVAGLIVGRD